MLMDIRYTPKKHDIVKIYRNGESFWLSITYVTRNRIYATVDSHVSYQAFHRGDTLCIDESEIIDVWID